MADDKSTLTDDVDRLVLDLMGDTGTIDRDQVIKINALKRAISKYTGMPTWLRLTHMMGRQIHSYASMLLGFVLLMCDKPIDLNSAILIGGSGIAYALAKGKGN